MNLTRVYRIVPLVLAQLVSVLPARADDPPASPASPAAAAPPASPAPPAPPDAAEPTPEATSASEEARAHHRRGLELYDEGDYRLALVEFQRAYSIGQNYKILFNIGQVHFQLNSYAKARLALEQYLAQGGEAIAPKRREDVEKDLATLRKRTATLTVRVNVADADVTINDSSAGKAPLENVLVDAGVLHVHVARPGYASCIREVTLAGGDTQVVVIDMPVAGPTFVAPTATPLPREAIAGWVVTGILTAGAITTGIITSVSASNYESKRKTAIPGSPAEARAELLQQRSDVKTLAFTTDVIGVTALVAGVVSLYLTLRERPKTDVAQVRVQGSGAMLTLGF